MSNPPKRLGRGLSSLISADLIHPKQEKSLQLPGSPSGDDVTPPRPRRMLMVSVEKIRRNPMQPRREFSPESLSSLAESLKTCGTLQPIVVRPSEGGYELIAGERRLRAAQLANLGELPAIIRSVPDDKLLQFALVENLQRENLNPVERARAYRLMCDKHGLSHEEVAKHLSEDRATVANYRRPLALPEDVLAMLGNGGISTGHAKAILGAPDDATRSRLARRAATEQWSVRRTEQAVARMRGGGGATGKRKEKRPAVVDMEEQLSTALGTRTRIEEGRRQHTGRLVIEYYSLDDFQRIVSRLGVEHEGPA